MGKLSALKRVGLIHVDGKLPNLALMKLSAWHKAQGDEVEFFIPLKPYDLVYASKVFTSTPDYEYAPAGTIRGGIGYNNDTLPDEIEHTCPDYTLYPGMTYAMGFTSRGCIRNCPWCVVPAKEGKARVTAHPKEFWTGQAHMMLLDSNITALPEWFIEVCKWLGENRIITDFNGGLDIRLIDDLMAVALSKVRPWKQWHFAWDSMRDEEAVKTGIKLLGLNGIAAYRCMFYVLIGYNTTPEEDQYRVEKLREWGVDPFVMPYDKTDLYQRRFARWVNHKAIFKSVKWEDYA